MGDSLPTARFDGIGSFILVEDEKVEEAKVGPHEFLSLCRSSSPVLIIPDYLNKSPNQLNNRNEVIQPKPKKDTSGDEEVKEEGKKEKDGKSGEFNVSLDELELPQHIRELLQERNIRTLEEFVQIKTKYHTLYEFCKEMQINFESKLEQAKQLISSKKKKVKMEEKGDDPTKSNEEMGESVGGITLKSPISLIPGSFVPILFLLIFFLIDVFRYR